MSAHVLHCPWVLLPDGWAADRYLHVDARGMISAVENETPAGPVERLSGPVIPGMCNAHSHVHQRLIAGLTGDRGGERDSFWTWRERMYQAVASLEADDFSLLATWAFMELLEGGYTTTGEFHYPHRIGGNHPQQTATDLIMAADRAGMNLTVLPVWYRYGGFGRVPVSERQQPFVLGLDEITELVWSLRQEYGSTSHRIGVAPHSLRAVDVADLPELVASIGDGPVHLHIAEQIAEVDDCRRHSGRTPIELLQEHLTLDQRWCLIHATHARCPEVEALARSSAVVCICPTTEADLGDGLFPVREFQELGGRVAIGSDSNLVTDALQELRLLEWGQRLRRRQRNVLLDDVGHIGEALWAGTARAGADALAQPAGCMEIGRRADLVVLNSRHPLLDGLSPGRQLDTAIMAAASGMIDQVRVGGRTVVENGLHPGRAELAGRIVQLRKKLETTGNAS